MWFGLGGESLIQILHRKLWIDDQISIKTENLLLIYWVRIVCAILGCRYVNSQPLGLGVLLHFSKLLALIRLFSFSCGLCLSQRAAISVLLYLADDDVVIDDVDVDFCAAR
jgi:hypothetical protein